MQNALIYCRTSKDDDSKEDGAKSIPEQVTDCQTLAKQHGYHVVATIKEPNRSGRTYPTGCPLASQDAAVTAYFNGSPYTRDGLAEVLRMLPQVSVVIVRDNTRLARPLSDSFLLNWLHQQFKNVKLHSVRDGLQDGSQNLMLRTITSMSEDTGIQTRRANSKAKLQQNKDNGKLANGIRLLGYRQAGKQKVEIDPKQAEVIRMIFKMKLDGHSICGITKHLNENQKGNKRYWKPEIVGNLLLRPQYFGYTFNSRKQLIPSTVIPAILPYSVDVLKQLMAEREKRKLSGARERKRMHYLSGIVRCGCCNARMTIWTVTQKNGDALVYYYCPVYKHSTPTARKEGCKNAGIREDFLDEFFGYWTSVLQDRVAQLDDSANTKAKLTALEAERAKTIKAQDKLFSMIADMEQSTFTRQSKVLETKLREIDGELAKLNLVPERKEIVPEDSKAFLRDVIQSIEIHENHISVLLKGETKPFSIPRLMKKDTRSKVLPVCARFMSSKAAFNAGKLELRLQCEGKAKGTIYDSSWLRLEA